MAIDCSWFWNLQPWVQGGLGGAAVTLLWQAISGRDRRSLAHVLSEEMAQNLNLVALQLDLIRAGQSPEAVRPWHSLSSIVFKSVVGRLGELPKLIGKVVAVYQVLEIVNRYPPLIIADWDKVNLEWQGSSGPPTPEQTEQLKHIRSLLSTFEDWLNKLKRYSEKLLPERRKASMPCSP
jgi:hypothetical protein